MPDTKGRTAIIADLLDQIATVWSKVAASIALNRANSEKK